MLLLLTALGFCADIFKEAKGQNPERVSVMQQLSGEENELSKFLKCHGLSLRLAEYHYSVKSEKCFLFFLQSAAA